MKRALVTGATGEIGSRIARRLAAEGLRVHVHTHRRMERAEALVEEIAAAGGNASTVSFDVTDPEDSKRALDDLLSEGPIQVLVNNAGIHRDAPMAGMDFIHWKSVVDVSLSGFFNVTQPLLLPMMGTRWGRIVNISSISGVLGNQGQTNYAAAKAGLHGATKSLARELAKRGITVNAIAPGIIDSESTRALFDRAAIERLVPMRRAGRPEEVADLVAYLVCGDSGYLSGQVICLDGAMT
ncbi:3-oxoacyl-(acyl-carrier-protein) reductase [Thiorhodococcus drewsii AZ1]|uniref:3-oxoacyl-(Acyl-carrier-protein) reductase n=1 Tax=Thiorhodococcus drewsii AZ1 TaxID=765913 RepID=G2E4T9_9GAMM|nr:3-oxoacyl-ACP reductase FabG [Thiorhodococcus drewsii]EGV29110.1 3-oxoacyl-(acyl-carrier-protein) reductase [Thiorhodococcus drewsii AZ1]